MRRFSLVLAVWLSACAHTNPGLIRDVQVPEDLIALPNSDWIVVSNLVGVDKPGWLSAIDTRHVERDPVRLFPGDAVVANANAHCPGPPDTSVFFPHGINVHGNDLLVVNHGGRESIEIFTIGHGPTLSWRDCIVLPADVSANGVDVLADGRIIATDMYDPHDEHVSTEVAQQAPTGRVIVWDGSAWHDFSSQRFSFANGIATSPQHVFVSEWGARKLWRFAPDGSQGRSIDVDFLPDNLRWTPNGTLLLAGQRTAAADLFACTMQHTPCPLAFSVVEVDPKTLAVRKHIEAGAGDFGGGTVAIAVDDELWVGSAAVDAIGRYPGAPLAERIDRVLDSALADKRIVGAVVLVARDGKLVYHRAVGQADREAHRPMREDAIFLLASLTKPFVASATLKLVDQGVLDLDAPVTRYLPEFTPALADESAPEIKVRDLLSHTSGLSYPFQETVDGPYHRARISTGVDQPGLTFAENERRLLTVSLVAAPGTRFNYGLSIDVLGEILARVTGKPLPEVVRTLITEPLGIRDTAFAVSDRARLVAAYADHTGEPERMSETLSRPMGNSSITFAPARIFDPASYPSGGAGMAGTASDVLRLLEWLRVDEPRIWGNQLRGADAGGLPGGFGFIGAVPHDGRVAWGGVYGHSWFIDRDRRQVVVLLTNTAMEGMNGRLVNELERVTR